MNNILHRYIFILLAIMSMQTACSPIEKGKYVDGTDDIFCDDGFKSILEEEIDVFEFTYPTASIMPFYVSEQDAIDSLLSDKTQSIIVTRELSQDQIDYLKSKFKRIVRQKCIAVDAVALITNNKNDVDILSMNDIKDILSGKITRWDQLGGNDSTKIKLVFDSNGSSTVNYMRDLFLAPNAKISDHANTYAQKNNAEVIDIVKEDKTALGIISVSWLGTDLEKAKDVPISKRYEDYKNENDTIGTNLTTEVNILKIRNPQESNDFDPVAYKPYQVYINSGQYPLYRKVFMISTAPKSSVMNSFYMFVTGFAGQKIITKTGILPYQVNSRVVELK